MRGVKIPVCVPYPVAVHGLTECQITFNADSSRICGSPRSRRRDGGCHAVLSGPGATLPRRWFRFLHGDVLDEGGHAVADEHTRPRDRPPPPFSNVADLVRPPPFAPPPCPPPLS